MPLPKVTAFFIVFPPALLEISPFISLFFRPSTEINKNKSFVSGKSIGTKVPQLVTFRNSSLKAGVFNPLVYKGFSPIGELVYRILVKIISKKYYYTV